MKSKVLMVVAIVAVSFAIANLGIVIFQTNRVSNVLLGPTDVGTAEVEIVSAVHIRFIVNSLDWGSGSVSTDPASLHTIASPFYDTNWDATVGDGPEDLGPDLTIMTGGLELENYGNVDVDLFLLADKGPDDFVCQSDVTCIASGLQNITWQLEEIEAGSCGIQVGPEWNRWVDANYTGTEGTLVCDDFLFAGSSNELELDMNLTIPISAPPGERTDTTDLEITATVQESS